MKQMKLNAMAMALCLRELQLGPSSVKDMHAVTGMNAATIRGYIRALRKHDCVHIVDYERDGAGRQRGPIFGLGEGDDTPRGARMDNQTKWKRQMQRRNFKIVERLAA